MNESAKCQSIPPAIKMKEKWKKLKAKSNAKIKGICQKSSRSRWPWRSLCSSSSKAWYVNFVFKGRHIHLTDVNLWPRSQKRPNKLLWVFMSVLHTRKMYINIHHAHCIKSHIFVQKWNFDEILQISDLNFCAKIE